MLETSASFEGRCLSSANARKKWHISTMEVKGTACYNTRSEI